MTRRLRVFPLALLLLIVALGSAANERPKPDRAPQAGTVIALVTGIVDGDSLYLNIDGRATLVRLAQIDAPEKKMPFGRRSEQSLRELVWKREVTATWRELDRYGRPLAQIIVDGIDVNAAQIERGMAWVYTQYATDPRLRELEADARRAKRGLWVDPDPVAPWVWRKAQTK